MLETEFTEWRKKAILNADKRVKENFNKLLKPNNHKCLLLGILLMLITIIILSCLIGYELKQPETIIKTINNEIIKPTEIIQQFPTKIINITNNIDKTQYYKADEICEYTDVKNQDGVWERRGKCKKINLETKII